MILIKFHIGSNLSVSCVVLFVRAQKSVMWRETTFVCKISEPDDVLEEGFSQQVLYDTIIARPVQWPRIK